jgi:DNA-binding transcriptional MerR regulator
MELLTIGAFARLAHLSPKALRLYDRLALLSPVRVDPETGYRWYSPDQLGRARRVALLRRLDMPLARISQVLDLAPADAAVALAEYWHEQERAVAAKRELVGFLINQLNGKRTTMYEVLVRELPARALLTLSKHLTADQIGEFAGPLFGRFGGAVPRPDGIAGAPFLRYHGEVTEDSDGPVDFCCPVDTSEIDDVVSRFPEMKADTEPAGREAYIRVPKSEMWTSLGFESLQQWLTENNEKPVGEVRQIFLTDPATVADDEIVFQLSVPLG